MSVKQTNKSLHDLIGKEYERYYLFRKKHYEKCGNPSKYIVKLSGTGIGECISVGCPYCQEVEDITDVDAW